MIQGAGALPADAPFNVDDNSSINEIYWYSSHNDATGETTTVKYTCQEMAYTVGGKVIASITVESDSPTVVYSANPAQTFLLKDGVPFLGTDTLSLGPVDVHVGGTP